MSDNTNRQPKGVPVGGQFSATTKAEPGFTLGSTPAEQGPKQAEALSVLADAIVFGDVVVVDDVDAAHEIVPNIPRRLLSDQMWHDVLVATVHRDDDAREKAITDLVNLDAREARWRNNPKFVAPTMEVTDAGSSGPVQYTTVTCSKYTGWRDVAEVAKDVRTDLKDAVDAGYLPDGLRFGVTVSKYAGGQSLRVSIRGMSDEDIFSNDETSWGSGRQFSQATIETRTRVEAIAGAYTKDTTDYQTDYFDVMYYTHVDVEDEPRAAFRVTEAARLKAGRGTRQTAAA